MKKIFTLIAVAAMALSVNAQSASQAIDFRSMKAGDFTVENATLSTEYSTETKFVYDIKGGDELKFTLKTASNVIFTITNASDKEKIFNVNVNGEESTDKASVEFGGKNGIVIINEPQVGDNISMNVAAKGSTAAVIGVLPSSGNDLIESTKLTLNKKDKNAEGADSEGYVWKDFTFTVTEDMIKTVEGVKVVRIKETAAGYRCKAISINAALPTGITAVKSVADVNAPAYNLAGQKVADGFKGLVIKNGKKFVNK